MDQTRPSLAKYRQQFYERLKKEDVDYVNARSNKEIIDLYRRKKSAGNPWLHCFYFNNNESENFFNKFSNCFASKENIRKCQIDKIISGCAGITDEEINYCKFAMRREARSRNLPDLSSKPHDLRLLFVEHGEKFPENFKKQKKLYEEIVCNMMNFEVSLKFGLEVLKPLSKITVAETSFQTATANIVKMRCIMQDFQTYADLVTKNLFKVVEKFERYQELDEKMDKDIFSFLSNFFPNFLIPRNKRKRGNTSK